MIAPSDAGDEGVAPEVVPDPLASLFAASRARFTEGPARAGGGAFLFLTLVLFVLSRRIAYERRRPRRRADHPGAGTS